MRIAHLAPLWLTVPPKDYGGLETILAYLIDAQVAQGHEVTLFTCAGSQTDAKLVEVIEKPMYELLGKFDWSAVQAYEFITFYELLKRADQFDIIHNHMGFHPLALTPALNVPVVTTNHSSVEPDFPYLSQLFKDQNFVSISNAQRENAPYLNYIDTIYNAVDAGKFSPRTDKGQDYFFFIGTLSPSKGLDIAVQAAHQLGENLVLAGEIRPEDQSFFDEKIKPFIDGEKIKFVGRVNHEQKVDLFRNAKALLFPSQWNEAFGMVAIEALASGTPVIGWDRGAIPEIVTSGQNGYVVDTFADFVTAMQSIHNIDREACVSDVKSRFSADTMAKRYVQIYQQVINQK